MITAAGPLPLFFAFAIAHALGDFPLQGDYIAREKCRRTAANRQSWFIALTAHSLIHSGLVWIISGSVMIAVAELCLHWLIDFGKGEGGYDDATDQLLHLLCKVVYVIVLTAGLLPYGMGLGG